MKLKILFLLFLLGFTAQISVAQKKVKLSHRYTYEILDGPYVKFSFLSDKEGDVIFFEEIPAAMKTKVMDVEYILLNMKEQTFVATGEKNGKVKKVDGPIEDLFGKVYKKLEDMPGKRIELIFSEKDCGEDCLEYSIFPEDEKDDPLDIELNTTSDFKADRFVETIINMLGLPADMNFNFKTGYITKISADHRDEQLAEISEVTKIKTILKPSSKGFTIKHKN